MSLSLSPEIQKIINDWHNHTLVLPAWFANNNINWVISGHITESEFLSGFSNLLNSGIAYYVTGPTPEPEPIPQAQPTSFYWIQKPSQQPRGRAEQYNITESTKQKWLSNGYIISTIEPVYQSGRVLWQDVTWFGKGICTNKHGERYTIVIPCATPTPPIVTPPIVTPPVIEIPEIIPEVIAEPQPDDSINTNMVTQQVINFNIINGRAVGSIKFVATNNFNPFYYNKEIINLVQFKTPNGVTLLVKENRLRFTESERDEIISYDESIQENTRITVESFVWEWMDKPAGAFSNKYSIDISEKEPPKPMTTGFMGAGAIGALAGLILIGFIADHKRGK